VQPAEKKTEGEVQRLCANRQPLVELPGLFKKRRHAREGEVGGAKLKGKTVDRQRNVMGGRTERTVSGGFAVRIWRSGRVGDYLALNVSIRVRLNRSGGKEEIGRQKKRKNCLCMLTNWNQAAPNIVGKSRGMKKTEKKVSR